MITSPLELKEAALEVCKMSYEEVSIKYPRDGQSKDVATKLCFSLSYTSSFLINGLHIPENKYITIQRNKDEINYL